VSNAKSTINWFAGKPLYPYYGGTRVRQESAHVAVLELKDGSITRVILLAD
jgi:hypothetical protein